MSTSPIDMAVYNDLADTAGAEFAAELAGTFLEEAPPILAELRAALGAQAAEGFRRAAHSLKSNGHTFGATRLAEMARELELGGLPADSALIDALEAEYLTVAAALAELIRG